MPETRCVGCLPTWDGEEVAAAGRRYCIENLWHGPRQFVTLCHLFRCVLMASSVPQATQHRILGGMVDIQLKIMWKEAIITYMYAPGMFLDIMSKSSKVKSCPHTDRDSTGMPSVRESETILLVLCLLDRASS